MQSGVIRSSSPAKVEHAHQVSKAQCPCEAQLRRWRSREGLRQLHQREATCGEAGQGAVVSTCMLAGGCVVEKGCGNSINARPPPAPLTSSVEELTSVEEMTSVEERPPPLLRRAAVTGVTARPLERSRFPTGAISPSEA